MKRLIVASIGVVAFGLTTASAADIRARPAPYPAPTPVYAPPPVYFSWTGCYFGGHIGGLWGQRRVILIPHKDHGLKSACLKIFGFGIIFRFGSGSITGANAVLIPIPIADQVARGLIPRECLC